jgi:hypothetical protein
LSCPLAFTAIDQANIGQIDLRYQLKGTKNDRPFPGRRFRSMLFRQNEFSRMIQSRAMFGFAADCRSPPVEAQASEAASSSSQTHMDDGAMGQA